uniref:Uncharacterized protein n=1 Tax=Steinernema glaseri TaxID=37863 RepID=A0A1I7Y464_9BILA
MSDSTFHLRSAPTSDTLGKERHSIYGGPKANFRICDDPTRSGERKPPSSVRKRTGAAKIPATKVQTSQHKCAIIGLGAPRRPGTITAGPQVDPMHGLRSGPATSTTGSSRTSNPGRQDVLPMRK